MTSSWENKGRSYKSKNRNTQDEEKKEKEKRKVQKTRITVIRWEIFRVITGHHKDKMSINKNIISQTLVHCWDRLGSMSRSDVHCK